MNTVKFKRKFLVVPILIVAALLCIIYVYGVKPLLNDGIFEIKNTKEVNNLPESKVITIKKHYIITSPPEDFQELKKKVEKFSQDNPIDRESGIDTNKERQYEAYFYRMSKRLPKEWQPDASNSNTDKIEYHIDDCIAIIRWSDSNQKKSYSIMKKSDRKIDYGAVLDEKTYSDN